MSIEALKLALEALKENQHLVADNERHAYVMEYNSIIEKCEEALAQPKEPEQPAQQEPVVYAVYCGYTLARKHSVHFEHDTANKVASEIESFDKEVRPLYTTPPQPKKPEQKPVAWMTIDSNGEEEDIWYDNPEGKLLEGWSCKPLYTRPRTWVGLTEQEHTELAIECGCLSADWVFYGEALERKIKEKNGI